MVSCCSILGSLPLSSFHSSACTRVLLAIQADIGPVREEVAQNEQAYKEADTVARAAVGPLACLTACVVDSTPCPSLLRFRVPACCL